MTKRKPQVLLVEEDNRSISTAQHYLEVVSKDVTLACDYATAMTHLQNPHFDCAIIDCFLTIETGSVDFSLGSDLVQRMRLSDPRERVICDYMSLLSRYVDLTTPEMKQLARHLAYNFEKSRDPTLDDLSRSLLIETLNTASRNGVSKNDLTALLKSSASLALLDSTVPSNIHDTFSDCLFKSPKNQPLGLLVLEKATELGIPGVLTTCKYDSPELCAAVKRYSAENKLPLVLGSSLAGAGKLSYGFWETAFKNVYRRVK